MNKLTVAIDGNTITISGATSLTAPRLSALEALLTTTEPERIETQLRAMATSYLQHASRQDLTWQELEGIYNLIVFASQLTAASQQL